MSFGEDVALLLRVLRTSRPAAAWLLEVAETHPSAAPWGSASPLLSRHPAASLRARHILWGYLDDKG